MSINDGWWVAQGVEGVEREEGMVVVVWCGVN
jgi:hypothetical protein